MNIIDETKLGFACINQKSIGEKIDQNLIENILLKNLEKFQKSTQTKDIDTFTDEFLSHLRKEKKLIFTLNKHIEIYVKHHIEDINKVFKYLIFRYKFLQAGGKKINLGYPPYLLIEPVSTCNLRCPFCFQTDKTFTKKPFMGVMDYSFFKKVIDEADKIGVGAITIASRGEPTLHKKITEMIKYVSSIKNIFEIKLNTNATFLSEDLCHAILKNNINQVVISADHYEKKTYEILRKNSNFEKIRRNVDNLFEIRKKQYPNSITEIRVTAVDYNKNLDKKKFRQFWIQRSDHVSAGDPLERWDTYNNDIHENINDPCEQLWDRMYVWFDGKVNPCDADYKSKLSFGNVKESSLIDVWNNSIIDKLRTDHLENSRLKINPCNRCGVTFV